MIVDVETALNVDYDLPISLTDDRAMTREVSPFDDVQTLKDYIVELVAEQRAGERSLRGQGGVVTGASRGIGRMLVEYLLGEGAQVVGISRGEATRRPRATPTMAVDVTERERCRWRSPAWPERTATSTS